MKTKNKPHFLLMAGIVALFAAFTVSCNKDDDPSLADLREDKLQYLEDSLRISDSLRLIGNAGVVNYAITVVDGSTSSVYQNGSRTEETQSAVDGAIVTISQYGKTFTDTTDASGIVVFNGFFRSAVNISIKKTDFTSVTYITGVNISDSTRTGTISFVGNMIPIFPLTGANTATISGRATIQTNLTNKTREAAPDGTKISASINATVGSPFAVRFLTKNVTDRTFKSTCGCQFVYVGNILQATYSTGVIGTVTGGNYSLTVPAAIDGLPLNLQYGEIGADQTLFETTAANGQRTIVQRAIFNDNSNTSTTSVAGLPTSSTVAVTFTNGSGASAFAVVSENAGTLSRINLIDDGSNYIAATPPLVQITGGGGSGATATATVGANGRVTGITLTNPGTGYTSIPTVTLVSGSGALATTTLQPNGTVISVGILNSGSGYVAATPPSVTFSAPPVAPGNVTATGVANVDANGRVTSVTITNPGLGYIANPTVNIAGPVTGTSATASAFYSGQSVNEINITNPGSNYTYAPRVIFTPNGVNGQRANGTPATGTATFDPITRQVTGIQITSAGSGYLLPPLVTLDAGSGATADAFLTGGSVTNIDIFTQGSSYVYPPLVVIGSSVSGGGQGATGTAVLQDGKIIGVTITNGGTGYTGTPDVLFVDGDNANAYATVTNGAITGITVTDGGRNFTGAPRVVITSGDGAGATATATVANGQITGVTVTAGGTGYLEGNTPGTAERFSATKGTSVETKSGMTYINDVHYGTGAIRHPN